MSHALLSELSWMKWGPLLSALIVQPAEIAPQKRHRGSKIWGKKGTKDTRSTNETKIRDHPKPTMQNRIPAWKRCDFENLSLHKLQIEEERCLFFGKCGELVVLQRCP